MTVFKGLRLQLKLWKMWNGMLGSVFMVIYVFPKGYEKLIWRKMTRVCAVLEFNS